MLPGAAAVWLCRTGKVETCLAVTLEELFSGVTRVTGGSSCGLGGFAGLELCRTVQK
jgi:hypothetical protein